MSAYEQRQQIDNALALANDAVANGAGAWAEVNEALTLLNKAMEKLNGSRAFALQEIGNLSDMIRILQFSTVGTNSVDGLQALANLESARSDLTNYANRIPLVRVNVQGARTVIERARKDQELKESGDKLRIAAQLLAVFRERL